MACTLRASSSAVMVPGSAEQRVSLQVQTAMACLTGQRGTFQRHGEYVGLHSMADFCGVNKPAGLSSNGDLCMHEIKSALVPIASVGASPPHHPRTHKAP